LAHALTAISPTQTHTLSLHERSSDLSGLEQIDHAAAERAFPQTRAGAFARTGRFAELHPPAGPEVGDGLARTAATDVVLAGGDQDRKSTRLNSSHGSISYAVFCLKKK